MITLKAGNTCWNVSETITQAAGQLSLVPSVGWKLTNGQSAVMLSGWGAFVK